MSTELSIFKFHGDEIPLVPDDNERPLISIRHFYENLGLAWQRQLRKLRTRSWAVVTKKAATGSDGKQYLMSCTDVRTALMSLATINEIMSRKNYGPSLSSISAR